MAPLAMRSLRMKILLITPVFRRSPQAPPVESREQAGSSQTLTKINDQTFMPLQPTSGVYHGIYETLSFMYNTPGSRPIGALDCPMRRPASSSRGHVQGRLVGLWFC